MQDIIYESVKQIFNPITSKISIRLIFHDLRNESESLHNLFYNSAGDIEQISLPIGDLH